MNESPVHPTSEELAAFADAALAPAERRRMVAHLDACTECREVVAETVLFQEEEAPRDQPVDRTFEERRPRLGRIEIRRLTWVAAAAAAVVAVLVVGPMLRRPAPDGAGSPGAGTVYLFSPADAAATAARLEAGRPLPAGAPWSDRARAVFERVRRATGVPARLELVELAEPAGRVPGAAGGPIAVADPATGAIRLDRAALELLFADRPAAEADALAAFVLAHELHHLRAERERMLAGRELAGGALADPGPLEEESEAEKEETADRGALVAAAAAGYDPSPIAGAPGAALLEAWLPGAGAEATAAAERAARLRAHVAEVVAALPDFEQAVALLERGEAGDAEGAIERLERFRTVYDGPEVLANLGLAHYLQAAAALAACDGAPLLRFVPPVAISRETPFSRLRGPADCLGSPTVERPATAAAEVLEASVARYPAHLPSWLDLAAVYLLRELPFAAEESARRALELAPDDPRALAAALVARYLQSGDPPAPAPELLADFAAARERFPEDADLAYAHARVLAETGRPDEAAAAWRRALENGLPEPWAGAARERLR